MKYAAKYSIIFLLISSTHSIISAQANKPGADELFEAKNYLEALEEYKKMEKGSVVDLDIKYRMGVCYLNINNDKSQAIPYFELVYRSGKYKNELLLELATACQLDYRLTDAVKFYNKYREKAPGKLLTLIDHYIETCENAAELMKKPVNITFENAGKEINSPFADYYPFVTKDEGTLFFTSRRAQNTGKLKSFNGYYTSDIYTSKVEKGVWMKAKNMANPINSAEDEECVGISADGKNLIMYVDNENYPGDLFHSEVLKGGKAFCRPVPFNTPVNSEQLEWEGCYSNEANTLYFVSNRKGGQGETDIYITKRLPNGEWGVPQNVGANVNTPYKEAFPVISEDGKTMFFSSQGHTSMGGFDIFRSRWNETLQLWDTPVNAGYPLNTTGDDMMFSVAGNGRDGYISAWRKEGFGDLDIYKIIFNDVEQQLAAIRGTVNISDSTKKAEEILISITNLKTNNEIDIKNVNEKTGKYIFIVEPGKYEVKIEAAGFITLKETVIVYDKSDFKGEIEKNFVLQREIPKPK